MAREVQEGPRLPPPYDADDVLQRLLARLLPAEVRAEIEPGLRRLGARSGGELLALAEEAEARPPRHLPYDAWGRRIDRIETAPAWARLHAVAAEEGLVATAWERRHGAHSRLHQFARIYLFHPSSAFVSCPLAMTDGAARLLADHAGDDLRARALPRLTSRDPERAWTAGQWMTEQAGGSDVGATETVARPDGTGGYRLDGAKWFTSAVNAEVALTLARIEGAPAGSRGLSVFYLEPRDAAGELVGIEIVRLKEKLGTRALPTAELALRGAPARLVGEPGRGVATIATLLNVTRLHNACCAAATLGRALALARDWAGRRRAFGRLLADHPAHLETLARLATEQAGALQLAFHAAALFGRVEAGEAGADERALLRLLTPVAKLTTGRQAVAGAAEAVECFGGAGYCEETGLPRLVRDAQVLPIWEGTTDVLALDALRAIARDGALAPLLADLERQLAAAREGPLVETAHQVRQSAGALQAWYRHAAEEPERLEAGARAFALGLGRAMAGALLVAQAAWELERGETRGLEMARRWAAGHLGPAPGAVAADLAAARLVALGDEAGAQAQAEE